MFVYLRVIRKHYISFPKRVFCSKFLLKSPTLFKIILESDSGESQKKGFNLDKWYESLDFDTIGNESGNSIMIKKL